MGTVVLGSDCTTHYFNSAVVNIANLQREHVCSLVIRNYQYKLCNAYCLRKLVLFVSPACSAGSWRSTDRYCYRHVLAERHGVVIEPPPKPHLFFLLKTLL